MVDWSFCAHKEQPFIAFSSRVPEATEAVLGRKIFCFVFLSFPSLLEGDFLTVYC